MPQSVHRSQQHAEAQAFVAAQDLVDAGMNIHMQATTVKNIDGSDAARPKRPVLAQDKLRYVGEAVALVVADTMEQARDAAELIELEYDDLPAKMDLAPGGAPVLPDPAAAAATGRLRLGEVAGGPVTRVEFAQRRAFDAAALLGVGAAGVEVAPLRRIQGAGHIAAETDFFLLRLRIGNGYGGQQGLGVRVVGRFVDFFGGADLDDFSEVHHGDVV